MSPSSSTPSPTMNQKRELITWDVCRLLLKVNKKVETSPLFEFNTLRQMGIQVVPVALDPKTETFQFSPCYFTPQPTTVLSDYPAIPSKDHKICDIEPLSYEGLLAKIKETKPRLKYPEKRAQREWETVVRLHLWEDGIDLDTRVGTLESHITSIRDCRRYGIKDKCSDRGQLEYLTPLVYEHFDQHPDHALNLDGICDRGSHPVLENWKVIEIRRCPDRDHPHFIIFVEHAYAATNDETFTVGEVRAIIRWMCTLHVDKAYKHHEMFPLLLITYTGPKHVRIIQAHHDGAKLVLQYTPLISFEDRNNLPSTLVVRYAASMPVKV
ncbi:hypothetical protein BDV59DRAFT_199113 [Aspergillus ambiguus]|uniref:uncharacterized protein n=1 Tax=Aspergillus ambiguus TaxID=176160 RepID=UPI003CCD85E0